MKLVNICAKIYKTGILETFCGCVGCVRGGVGGISSPVRHKNLFFMGHLVIYAIFQPAKETRAWTLYNSAPVYLRIPQRQIKSE